MPRSWMRLPRRTARLRLTLLYSSLFLICGAALLAITYALVRASVPATTKVPSGLIRVAPPAPSHGAPTHALGRPHQRPPGTTPSAAALVQIAESQKKTDLNHQLVWSGVALAIMTLVSIGLGWLVAGRVLRPLRRITRTARAITARDLGERLALDGADDEIKELADTLDDLFARLQAAFESQRHFVANASHELRTPVTVERSLLQVALADPNPTVESLLATCQNALFNNNHQHHLIEGLLSLASSESGLDHCEPLDLAVLARQALLTCRSEIDKLNLKLETTLQPAAVEGDSRLLERLVRNLIENAMHHNTPHGCVEVSTGTHQHSAYLIVTNTGPVIPINEVQRLFQPFQRLNGTRERHKNGHGLGLSIVQAVATAHRATLTANPFPGGGLAIDVTFPETGWGANTADASMRLPGATSPEPAEVAPTFSSTFPHPAELGDDGHARRSRKGGGDTALESQPTGDVRESSQPPPTRVSAPQRTAPAEDDSEFGNDL